MTEHLALRRGREIQADLVCMLCARTAGRAHGPDVRALTSMSFRARDPGHASAVRRLRCPHCSGRLWLQNNEEVSVYRPSFDREAPAPSADDTEAVAPSADPALEEAAG